MAYGKRVKFETLRTAAFGAIGAAYAAVGAALGDPARVVIITNLTDQNVLISIDGATNHLLMAANGYLVLDFTSNKVRDDGFEISEGVIFYAMHAGVAPTSGNLYISVVHA